MEQVMNHVGKAKKDLLDIVFEYKNKAYGAYVLRRDYVKTLTQSKAVVLGLLLLFFGGSYLSKYLSSKQKDVKIVKNVDFKMEAPPPIDKEEEPPPPPKLPEQIKIEKFTPPVIVEDNEVRQEDEVKPVDEIKGNVGTIEQEGTTDVVPVVDAGPGEDQTDYNKNFTMAEITKNASFPGGEDKLFQFLNDNLEYPEMERENETQGTVKIEFVIDKEGNVTGVKVKKSVSPGLDDEAVRVVKKMPKWVPAEYNGRKVSLIFVLPITFSL